MDEQRLLGEDRLQDIERKLDWEEYGEPHEDIRALIAEVRRLQNRKPPEWLGAQIGEVIGFIDCGPANEFAPPEGSEPNPDCAKFGEG